MEMPGSSILEIILLTPKEKKQRQLAQFLNVSMFAFSSIFISHHQLILTEIVMMCVCIGKGVDRTVYRSVIVSAVLWECCLRTC